MKRFKFDERRRPDMGNRRRVDDNADVEAFAEDVTIHSDEVPDRQQRRYDAEDLLEKAERESPDGIEHDRGDKTDDEGVSQEAA